MFQGQEDNAHEHEQTLSHDSRSGPTSSQCPFIILGRNLFFSLENVFHPSTPTPKFIVWNFSISTQNTHSLV